MNVEYMEEVPFLLLTHQLAHQAKYQALSRLEKWGLTPSQAGILLVLNKRGALSQRELADLTGVKPSSMTVAVRKLEKLGYVTRECDQEDLRISRIRLTEAGRDCIAAAREIITQTENELLQGFTQEEKLLLRRFLIQMQNNLTTERKDKVYEKIIRVFETV